MLNSQRPTPNRQHRTLKIERQALGNPQLTVSWSSESCKARPLVSYANKARKRSSILISTHTRSGGAESADRKRKCFARANRAGRSGEPRGGGMLLVSAR